LAGAGADGVNLDIGAGSATARGDIVLNCASVAAS
jgi:hypothetical protein